MTPPPEQPVIQSPPMSKSPNSDLSTQTPPVPDAHSVSSTGHVISPSSPLGGMELNKNESANNEIGPNTTEGSTNDFGSVANKDGQAENLVLGQDSPMLGQDGKRVLCKFQERGCDFIHTVTNHEDVCPYRPVSCPYLKCEELVSAVDVVEHLKSTHPSIVWLGEIQKGFMSRQNWYLNLDSFRGRNAWVPTVCERNGLSFVMILSRESNGVWCSWIYILSHRYDSTKYSYKARIQNMKRASGYNYYGRIHPIDTSYRDIIETKDCFTISDDVVKAYMTDVGEEAEQFQQGYPHRLSIEYNIVS